MPSRPEDPKADAEVVGTASQGSEASGIITGTQERLDGLGVTQQSPSVIIRPEGFVDVVEKPYERLLESLRSCYGVDTRGMVSMDDLLRSGEVEEVLARARTYQEHCDHECNMRFVGAPPLARPHRYDKHQLVRQINVNPVEGQIDTFTSETFGDDEIWGDESGEGPAQYGFVNCAPDIEKMPYGVTVGRSDTMIKAFLAGMERDGVEPLSDVRMYLAMHMYALANGSRLDKRMVTPLNMKQVANGASHVARGCWDHVRVYLNSRHPENHDAYLRPRAMLGVDVPSA